MSELDPFAASTWVVCPQCAARLPCHDPASSRYFGCFNCRTYFRAVPAGAAPGHRLDGFKRALFPGPGLPLGAVGELGGYRCRLTGYQVRSEKDDPTAEWREYQLRPTGPLPDGEPLDRPLQLAEYQGHWLLIRRAVDYPAPEDATDTQGYPGREWHDEVAGRTYCVWHRYQPVVRDALGEFDWNILDDEPLFISEFSSPPYLLVSEHRPGELPAWYLAEHLEPAQVAATFGVLVAALPAREGIGAAQPAPVTGWPQLRRLAWVGVLLLTMAQLGIMLRQPVELVAQDFVVVPGPAATSQMLVSESFELASYTALQVELAAPELTNHWVEVTASLVQEQTGRGYEFTRSIEYYEGVASGEHWAEGSRLAGAVLGAVPGGRYHFNLYPTVAAGTGPASLTLRVEENTTLWSNYFLLLGALALVPLAVWWRRRNFEQSRWENSEFGPS